MISLTDNVNTDTEVSGDFTRDYAGFIQSRRSRITREAYTSGISVILGDTKPDAFLEYARSNPRAAETKLIGWVLKYRDTPGRYGKKPAGATFRAYLSSMKSFLEFCDVTLNWKRIISVAPQARKASKKRGYQDQEIRPLYDFLDLRGKLAVLFYSSTGARSAAIDDPRPLTVGDIERLTYDIEGKKVTIGHIKIYGEEMQEYDGYLTDECLAGLEAYLNFRKTFGEKITNESPIFRRELDIREARKGSKNANPTIVRPASADAIQAQIAKGLMAVGYQNREFKMVHGFRFRFKTKLENTPLKSIYIERLLGHFSGEEDPDNYLKTDYKTLGGQFAKIQTSLYVTEATTARVKIAELEEEKDATIAEQNKRITELEAGLSELLRLAKEQKAKDTPTPPQTV